MFSHDLSVLPSSPHVYILNVKKSVQLQNCSRLRVLFLEKLGEEKAFASAKMSVFYNGVRFHLLTRVGNDKRKAGA